MKRYKGYDIQQDNANKYRVIETDSTGTRRAIDFPPCESVAAAKRFINEIEEGETMKSAKTCKEWNESGKS